MAQPSTQPTSAHDETDPPNTDDVEEYIKAKQEEYQSYGWKDDDLWEQFKDDFSDFTEEIFKTCNLQALRQLRSFLRTRGIKVTKDRRVTIARSLLRTIQEEEPAAWSTEEIQDHLDNEGPFLSYRINRILEKSSVKSPEPSTQPVAKTQHQHDQLTAPNHTQNHSGQAAEHLQNPPGQPQPQPNHPLTQNLQQNDQPIVQDNAPSSQTHTQTGSQPPIGQTSEQLQAPIGQFNVQPPVHQLSLGQAPVQNHPQMPPSQNYGKELANLAKLYTENTKYSGDNDNFDYKLMIFYDLCEKAALPQQAFGQAYSTMLRGLALDHYYTNRKNASYTLPFEQMCCATRSYFEGAEHKRNVLNRWNETTLRTVITKNPEKSTLECLQLLINDLRHLQHGLENNLKTDDFLHNKIITACITHEACRFACCKPATTVTGLISELRTSITAYKATRPQDDPPEAYFTDRQYHRRYQQPSRARRTSGNYPFRPPQKTKKCFVCYKEGCWSTKHTQEERDKSRKRFENRLNQYITEYEGEEDVDSEIEALIVDYNSDDFTDDFG